MGIEDAKVFIYWNLNIQTKRNCWTASKINHAVLKNRYTQITTIVNNGMAILKDENTKLLKEY